MPNPTSTEAVLSEDLLGFYTSQRPLQTPGASGASEEMSTPVTPPAERRRKQVAVSRERRSAQEIQEEIKTFSLLDYEKPNKWRL